jgi:hypothetical protein
MPTFTRTLFGIAPLYDANLTVIFTKHDVKAINQPEPPSSKVGVTPVEPGTGIFPIVNANYNSNEDSLFPSNDKLTSIPPPDPPPEPPPPPATPVPATYNSYEDSLFPSDDELTSIPPPNPPPAPIPPPETPGPNTYWDCIKNKRWPAILVKLTYRQQLDRGLVTTTKQNKRQCIEMACAANLYTTTSYPCVQTHASPPPTSSPQAANAYDLPSISSLIRLHHAFAGNPVPTTWFAAIKAGNYKTFLGLTLRNTMKHCPSSDATIKGHLKQTHQGICSTKPMPRSSNHFSPLATPDALTTDKPEDPIHKPTALPSTNKLYITDFLLAKLYTDDTGKLPIQACSGNQYITIAFHSCCNAILCTPYVNRSNKHQLAAYNSIMHRLANRGHNVDLQILDNEVSTKFKATIVD